MNILRLSALLLVTMMLIPIGASAHCDEDLHAGDHPHCDPLSPGGTAGGGGGNEGGGTYMMEIGESLDHDEIDGNSNGDLYVGRPKGVGLNTSGNGGPLATDFTLGPIVEFFNNAPNPVGGDNCFVSTTELQMPGQVGVNKVKKGRVEATFFFPGLTDGSGAPVNYLVILTGDFVSSAHVLGPPSSWPPDMDDPALMHMDKWETKISGGGASLANSSCIAGPVDFAVEGVDIEITRL